MRSFAVLGLVIAVGACTDPSVAASPTPQSSELAAGATATPPPTTSPTPTPHPTIGPLPSDLDPDIRKAIEDRRMYRLRFDLAYVLEVASDPKAFDAIGFPIYQAEWEQIGRDQAEQDRIIRAVSQHPAPADEFGGLYIDREDMPGVVVALFTADVAAHEAAIREKLGDTELFATRQVKYSQAELASIQARISQDMGAPWVLKIPATIESVGAHVSSNVVVIGVSSAVPDAAERIAGRYDFGDRIRVESDGTGVKLIPWGNVEGRVTLPGGKAFKTPISTPLMLTSDGPGDSIGTCNGSDMGYGVDVDGRFDYPCQVGRRTIYIQAPTEQDGGWRSIGQGTVVVEEGKTARLDIELRERP